jgi:hypothetical protein
MASKQIRLTETIREHIILHAVRYTFDERRKELGERESIITNKAIDYVIGDDNLRLMKKLPDNFFAYRTDIRIHSKDNYSYKKLLNGRLVPAFIAYSGAELPATNGLWREINAVDREKAALEDERGELTTKIRAMLAGITTVKRLLEVWPESEPFLPSFEEKANLPAVQAEDLNTMIKKYGKK